MTQLTRREILSRAALVAAGITGSKMSALANVTLGSERVHNGGDTLVVMFLRGGADGLNIVAPYGDDHYYKLRPNLALPGPNDKKSSAGARVVRLDDFFGLHPALGSLRPVLDSGQLTAVHAVGSGDQSRSHFEAMEAMERGLAQASGISSGWLARHLAVTASQPESPIRSVAIGQVMPDSLRGATSATALRTLSDFKLSSAYAEPTGSGGKIFHKNKRVVTTRAEAFEETLTAIYSEQKPGADSKIGGLKLGGRASLDAMKAVKRLDPDHYRPTPGTAYPAGEVGDGFKQVACLIKGEVGLEIACLDMGGWDTHVAQGREIGWQALRLDELGKALAAFAHDLGPKMGRVTTIVMTEFGRRAYENSGLGTDHGRASCMLLMGGSVVAGKVHSKWPGLAPGKLDPVGDLRVTTDYRDVLAEILDHRLKNHDLTEVFPNYTSHFQGIVHG